LPVVTSVQAHSSICMLWLSSRRLMGCCSEAQRKLCMHGAIAACRPTLLGVPSYGLLVCGAARLFA
jgi:hypothetical protein